MQGRMKYSLYFWNYFVLPRICMMLVKVLEHENPLSMQFSISVVPNICVRFLTPTKTLLMGTQLKISLLRNSPATSKQLTWQWVFIFLLCRLLLVLPIYADTCTIKMQMILVYRSQSYSKHCRLSCWETAWSSQGCRYWWWDVDANSGHPIWGLIAQFKWSPLTLAENTLLL